MSATNDDNNANKKNLVLMLQNYNVFTFIEMFLSLILYYFQNRFLVYVFSIILSTFLNDSKLKDAMHSD